MKRVLVIEDDLVSNLLLSALIRDQGFTTMSAHSIQETRDLLDLESFQFIFVDNKLPDGLGIEFLPEIRSRQPKAFVIVMSAESFKDNIDKAHDNGANEFLSKPLSHREIKRVLNGNQ